MSLSLFIQNIGRTFCEETWDGQIYIVRAQFGKPVEISLTVGRANVIAAQQFVTVQTWHTDSLPDVCPT